MIDCVGKRRAGPLRWVPAASALAFVVLATGVGSTLPVHAQSIFGERTYAYQPSDVLPGAQSFARKEGYWEAYGSGVGKSRELLGYVFLTDDLTEIPGYSGHSLNTLVGIDPEGTITGVKIVHHSEPIVLIGLSEKVIHDFVAQYVGKRIQNRIIISNTPRDGYVSLDAITGATVTAVAENATILAAGRHLGRAVGILKASQVRSRRPSDRFEEMDWKALEASEAIGKIVVDPEAVGMATGVSALELRFAVLDVPAVGRNLLGDRFYTNVSERLERQGGSALFIGASGSLSFKGAGFARGGLFDRFSLEQAGDLFVFKDVDYINFPALPIEGAPDFREGGIFFVNDDRFDPAEQFTFHLTLPFRIRDKLTYGSFLTDFRLPGNFVEEEVPFWRTRWQQSAATTVTFALFIVAVMLAFAFRQSLLAYRKPLHYTVAIVATLWVGIYLRAQPSTTQILSLATSAAQLRFPYEIFLSEPLIFLFWIVIAVSLVVWGRGFFCGWLCPYGALLELLIGLWQRICPQALRHRIDAWHPGPVWRSGKYVTFVVILLVAFANLPAAEALAEVEPFKTFILRLARPSAFIAYFVIVTALSAVSYRFFCRFLCPLGGALAIVSRRPAVPLVRYQQCTSCKICYRGCEPQAISKSTGRIDYQECLQCWDCQATGKDQGVCPELIRARKANVAPRFLVSALILATTAALCPSPSWARTRTVSPGDGALSAEIAASTDGDIILVTPGVYTENVVVDRRVAIIASAGAVVDGGGNGNVLVVDAAGVVVQGLTLRGCGTDPAVSEAGIRVEQHASQVRLQGNRIEQCRFGIWIHGSEGAMLIGNSVQGMTEVTRNERGDCIHLWSARGVKITGNSLADCRDGVYMELSTDCEVTGNTIEDSRYSVHTMWCDRSVYNDNIVSGNFVGLALMFSKHIQAKGNTLYDNATHGILLTQVTRSEVSGNNIIGNTKGLFVYNSLYNVIRANLVARNNLGMHYWGGSEDNEVDGNTFVENEIQVKFIASHDQQWNGNFWSDYVGWDMNGDERGDLPYHSNSLADSFLWKYPAAKFLLAGPALQLLVLAEREFPVIRVPKGVDGSPLMEPATLEWESILASHPRRPKAYYGELAKLPHIPQEGR